jgi:chromosome partitioning protein
MTKIIATVNQSGGAGKSTLTQNMGYHLAEKHQVLLIDMDPQASLTAFMGLGKEKITDEQNIYGAITERAPLHIWDNPIHGMHIIPTNIRLAGTEREILQDMTVDNRTRLKLVLDEVLDKFDYILIDCPPSLGILSIMSLVAATHVVIPLQTQYKCYLGTDQLLQTITRIKKGGHQTLEIACIVPMMYDGRNLQDAGILSEVKKQLEGRIQVTTPIPKSTAFPDAAQAHVPLALYKKNHPAVNIFQEIANYINKV